MDYCEIARMVAKDVFVKMNPVNRFDNWDIRRVNDMVIVNDAPFPVGKEETIICDKTALLITAPNTSISSGVKIIVDSIIKTTGGKAPTNVYFAIAPAKQLVSTSENQAAILFVYGLKPAGFSTPYRCVLYGVEVNSFGFFRQNELEMRVFNPAFYGKKLNLILEEAEDL